MVNVLRDFTRLITWGNVASRSSNNQWRWSGMMTQAKELIRFRS